MSSIEDPDPDLASELRQTAGREWSEEAAEDERLSELLRRRRMPLHAVMAELRSRGDRVSATFGGHTFSGSMVGAGDDFITVSGSGQTADIRLEKATWSILVAGEPGESREEGVDSFLALLKTYEADRSTVRVALPGGEVVIGRISVVASDHIELTDVDDRRLYIPTDLILATIRSTDFH